MYKIGLVGKANSGKNTVGNLIISELEKNKKNKLNFQSFAFADPIKSMAKLMFPKIQDVHLYGASHFRNTIIESVQNKEGNPLTIRKVLTDIGDLGRKYKDDIWLDCMLEKIEKVEKEKVDGIIITDVRFRNEFDRLKSIGFLLIKVERENQTEISHISETSQDEILLNEYYKIIYNYGNLENLTEIIKKEIVPNLTIT